MSGPYAFVPDSEQVGGASIEATLERWAASLRDAEARIRPLFTQERAAVSAGQFLDGLLGPERRKTGWMRAEAAGDPGPWRQRCAPRRLNHAFCGRARDPGAVHPEPRTAIPVARSFARLKGPALSPAERRPKR
jgi:hypothetical protein